MGAEKNDKHAKLNPADAKVDPDVTADEIGEAMKRASIVVGPSPSLVALERIAVALERLANAFAPDDRARGTAGRPLARTCPVGHGMQATDDYCQACKALEMGPPKQTRLPSPPSAA